MSINHLFWESYLGGYGGILGEIYLICTVCSQYTVKDWNPNSATFRNGDKPAVLEKTAVLGEAVNRG